MTPDWIRAKADSLAEAWRQTFGQLPTKKQVGAGLCVAIHETQAGDAWPGDHNWGACTKGALHPAQKAALAAAGIHAASPSSAARYALEAQATQALIAAGCPVDADQAIHIDSSPTSGWYFTTFGKFPDDVSGAAYFVRILVVQRAQCRAILTSGGGVAALAAAMFRSKYFTGFVKAENDTPEAHAAADQANIAAYAAALARIYPSVVAALADWSPTAPPPPEAVDTIDTAEVAANLSTSLYESTDPAKV